MTLASGVGSLPGDAMHAHHDEALRFVLGELSLPHLVELPGRGAHANMTGRALAVVAELGADLQPAGWRLTGSGGGSGPAPSRSRCSARTSTPSRSRTQDYVGPPEDPGGWAMDPGGDRRASPW